MAIKADPPSFPADEALAVVKSDSADIAGVPESGARIYVGVTGDVKVNMARTGAGIVFKAVPAGTTLPIRVTRVLSTGTTATDMVALW